MVELEFVRSGMDLSLLRCIIVESCLQDCPSKMGGLYLDMFLAQLVAGGSSVFAAMGPLPSPTPPVPSQHRASSSVSALSAFAGVAHSLKEPSHQSAHSASPRTDDMTLAIAMSMLSSGPLALKIAIVSPKGARQVL